MAEPPISLELEMDLELAQFRKRMRDVVRIAGREGARAGDELADGIRDGADEASDAVRKGAKDAGDAWSGVGEAIRGGLALAGVSLAADAVFDYANAVVAARQETINLSEATGISTATFGAFELAANRSGVEVSEILGGFEDFGEVLFDFSQGGGRAEEALRMLGYSSEDVAGRLDDVDGVAVELIEKMRGIEDAGLRNAVAQQLFGDAGNRLNAILGDAPLEEWIAAAQELGVTVDQDAVRATEDWNRATAVLGEAFGQTGGALITFLQSAASPVIENFALGFVFLRDAVTEAVNRMTQRFGRFVEIVRTALAGDFSAALDLASDELGILVEDYEAVGTAAFEGARAFYSTQQALQTTTTATDRQSTSLRRLTGETEATREAADALRRSQQEAAETERALRQQREFDRQLLDELARAHESLGDIAARATSDLLSPLEAIEAARDQELATIRELEAVTGETAQSRAAAEAVVQQAIRQTEQVERDAQVASLERFASVADAAVDTAGQVADAIGTFADLQLDAIETGARRTREQLDATTARIDELNEQLLEETDARAQAEIALEIQRSEELLGIQQAELEGRQAQYESHFQARKALEIAGVIISGAAAAISALAPPPIGAGPIVGAFVAAGVAATTTAAVAQIAAQKPPQFHAGYAGYTETGDEFTARLAGNETVNNARATDALGGPSGVAELNATGRVPGAPGRRAVRPGELGRLLGQLVAEELDAGRELTRAIQRGRPRPGVRPVFAR